MHAYKTEPWHSQFTSIAFSILLLFSGFVFALDLSQKLLRFVEERYGSAAANRLIEWENLANSQANANLPTLEKLNLVNNFFNRTRFLSDQSHWGKEDYWASPVEMLVTNGGDCEDYSIAKYFTLRELGIPEDKLKITYVKALKLNQAHMVLSYYEEPGSEPIILDNLIKDIRPASERDDLLPVYSFNGEGLWLSKMRGQEGKRIGDAEKLKLWSELITRYNILLDP